MLPGQEPDYEWLRALFRGIAHSECIEYDSIFDWTVLAYLQQAQKESEGRDWRV